MVDQDIEFIELLCHEGNSTMDPVTVAEVTFALKWLNHNKAVDVGPYNYQKELYTGKHLYLPKALREHMQGGVCMPCGLLFYVCWIIKMHTCGKKR